MRTNNLSKAAVRDKAATETKDFLVIAAYLFIVFSALLFFKSAILQGEGIDWAPWGLAAVRAAVSAKFILLARAFHLGEGHRSKPLIWETLHKTFAFLLFAIALMVVEEALTGLIHGRAFWESMSNIGGGTIEQRIATFVILFLVFLPMFAFGALGKVMGDKVLVRLFFLERLEFEVVKRRAEA